MVHQRVEPTTKQLQIEIIGDRLFKHGVIFYGALCAVTGLT